MENTNEKQLSCNFCGKRQDEVKHLIVGPPGANICDECILVGVDLIRENIPDFCGKFECPMMLQTEVIREYEKTMREAVAALKNLREGSA